MTRNVALILMHSSNAKIPFAKPIVDRQLDNDMGIHVLLTTPSTPLLHSPYLSKTSVEAKHVQVCSLIKNSHELSKTALQIEAFTKTGSKDTSSQIYKAISMPIAQVDMLNRNNNAFTARFFLGGLWCNRGLGFVDEGLAANRR